MKRWFRNILKGTSLSAALFVFQACYGMPRGYEDHWMEFEVVDGSTMKPIPDADVKIKCASEGWVSAGITDKDGRTSLISSGQSSVNLRFQADNYQTKDTTITDLSYRLITIKMFEE